MPQRLHSLTFALEQTDLARWQRENAPIVEVESIRDDQHLNGWYSLTIGDKTHPDQRRSSQSLDDIENALVALASPEYVKGARA